MITNDCAGHVKFEMLLSVFPEMSKNLLRAIVLLSKKYLYSSGYKFASRTCT